jgi:hypothetical protein
MKLVLLSVLIAYVSAKSLLAMTVNTDRLTNNRYSNITDTQSGSMQTIASFGDEVGALPGACAYDPSKNLFYFMNINTGTYEMSVYMLDSVSGKTQKKFSTNSSMSFLQVDRTTHKVYTVAFIDHKTVLASINFEKNSFDIVSTIDLDGTTSDGSTYCQHDHKFFFTTSEDNMFGLYMIDVPTGKIVSHAQMEYMVINMEHDSKHGALYASILNTDGSRQLVELDHKSGKVTRVIGALVLVTADGYTSYYDEDEMLYYYVAYLQGSNAPVLVAVDVKTGQSQISKALNYSIECLKR